MQRRPATRGSPPTTRSATDAQHVPASGHRATILPSSVGVGEPDIEWRVALPPGSRSESTPYSSTTSAPPDVISTTVQRAFHGGRRHRLNGHAGSATTWPRCRARARFARKISNHLHQRLRHVRYFDETLAETRARLNRDDPTVRSTWRSSRTPCLRNSRPRNGRYGAHQRLLNISAPRTYEAMFRNIDANQIVVVTARKTTCLRRPRRWRLPPQPPLPPGDLDAGTVPPPDPPPTDPPLPIRPRSALRDVDAGGTPPAIDASDGSDPIPREAATVGSTWHARPARHGGRGAARDGDLAPEAPARIEDRKRPRAEATRQGTIRAKALSCGSMVRGEQLDASSRCGSGVYRDRHDRARSAKRSGSPRFCALLTSMTCPRSWPVIGELLQRRTASAGPRSRPSAGCLRIFAHRGGGESCLFRMAEASGPGSQTRRAALLLDLMSKSTEVEQVFLRGLLVGNLRQERLRRDVRCHRDGGPRPRQRRPSCDDAPR